MNDSRGNDQFGGVPSPAPVDMVSVPPVVELRGAAARVGGRLVWDEVDLEVGTGEFAAVLGPNGAGKSTMIKVLLGLLPLAAGTATVMGSPPAQARRDIGYLPQRRSFDPAVRIRGVDIVRLGIDGDRWGIPLPFPRRKHRGAVQARVDEVIELVGAGGYATRPIGQLSGGEQQRLLIAQALVRRPRLLFLDEPLDSLDLPNQSAIAGLIASICRDQGVTVLLVAHDVNPILAYLDRVIYLGGGGAAIGPPAEVITSASLSRLYGAAVEVLTTSDGRLVVVGQPEGEIHHGHRHVS